MTQLELFTQSEIDDQSYPVVIPASLFLKPGSAEAARMTDTSGQKYFPLFKKSDQIGLFVKTFLDTSLWASTRCFLTWQTKPITQSKHFILELYPSMPHIEECDSGSSQEMWATPSAADSKGTTVGGQNKSLRTDVKMWPTPLAQEAKHGQVTQWEMETDHAATKNSLRVAVAKQMWPTPNASDSKQANMKDGHDIKKGYLRGVVKMYPTPTAGLEKHSTKEAYWENRIQKGRQEDIQMRVYKETGSGSLNPNWAEWLMGYPDGWTSLETSQE